MKTSKFVIEASEAKSMAESLNLQSVKDLLPHLVPSAQSLARAPISKFNVGAVGLGGDGRVYLGVNVEFPFAPLHHSIHAEQFLLTNLSVHRCTRLIAFSVSAAPCGHCRQFLQELRGSSELHILITQTLNDGDLGFNFNPLLKLLPNPFGPYDLLDQEHPLLLEQHDNRLELIGNGEKLGSELIGNDEKLKRSEAEFEKLENGGAENGFEFKSFESLEIGNEGKLRKLKKLAIEAANNAHAPYSGCASGVALMDCDGNVYRGSYAESAAYNPSLGPVQAALVAYIAGGGAGYDKIVSAVLVEKEGAIVKQEDTARMLLKAVSPKCELEVFLCRSVEDNNGYIEVST